MIARTTTKLTPAQLEEFESTFRHFDRDQTNTLGVNEFSAALSALGIVYSDADTCSIHEQLSGEIEGRITFQDFIDFLVSASRNCTCEAANMLIIKGIQLHRPISPKIRHHLIRYESLSPVLPKARYAQMPICRLLS